MTIMLAPQPSASYGTTSGDTYASNQYGIIANVLTLSDVADLQLQGCQVLSTFAPTEQIGVLKLANFNFTGDQKFIFGFIGRYRIRRITVMNASISLTTAAGGLYTGAAKTGSTIVAAGQAYSALNANTVALDLTMNVPNLVLADGTPLYLSLTTAQGAPVTADVYVFGDIY